MTRDEAVKTLIDMANALYLNPDTSQGVALKMAIKALEKDPEIEDIKVRDAIALLAYDTNYEIKGAYSGKIYHKSWVNKKEHAEKFYDETVTDNPFYSTGRMPATTGTVYFSPVIGIWMHDYHLCEKPQESEEQE